MFKNLSFSFVSGIFTLLISLNSHADLELFCETGDPSGRGAQAYVISNKNSNGQIEVRWISSRSKETKYLLTPLAKKTGRDEFNNPIRVNTYLASVGVRFELTQFLQNTKVYLLTLKTNFNATKLSCF